MEIGSLHTDIFCSLGDISVTRLEGFYQKGLFCLPKILFQDLLCGFDIAPVDKIHCAPAVVRGDLERSSGHNVLIDIVGHHLWVRRVTRGDGAGQTVRRFRGHVRITDRNARNVHGRPAVKPVPAGGARSLSQGSGCAARRGRPG